MTILTIIFLRVLQVTSHSLEICTPIKQETHLYVPKTNSVKYGENSFKLKSIHAWNSLVNAFPESDFISLPKKVFKNLSVSYFLNNYN